MGVVGVGHLGSIHARLLATHPEGTLVAVADSDREHAERCGRAHGVESFLDYRQLSGRVDAVCIAVPTPLHREIAGFFLENGVDVLVEKPIASNLAEGRELVELSRRHQRVLAIGHVERFNPALRAMSDLGIRVRYVESQRLAPFSFRSMDVGVVLDLMIHDLDLVLAMVRSPIERIDAFGGAVFTRNEDMASAIIRFQDGAVAHLTASRVALKPVRKLRVFSKDAYVSMDLNSAKATLIRKGADVEPEQVLAMNIDGSKPEDLWRLVFEGLLTVRDLKIDERNALLDEQSDFLAAVRDRTQPRVTGEEGCAALEAAEMVVSALGENRW